MNLGVTMRQLSILRVISVLVLFLFAGQVHAAEWRVVKIIGDAWVQSGAGAKKIAATRGLQLSGRTKIVTGRNGKVVLARGRESMIVGPGSRVDIPTAKNGRTLIRQDSGVVEYQARKRDIRHFEVRTPVLATIVKGTKFTVTQNNRLAQVAVSEGAVQVVHFAR